MYYLLGYRLMSSSMDDEQKELTAENTYILTLDGDIDFHPTAVKSLVDFMKKDKELGAACARIHPVGKGILYYIAVCHILLLLYTSLLEVNREKYFCHFKKMSVCTQVR